MFKYILFCLMTCNVMFADLHEDILDKCPKQYKEFDDDISNYLIRMEDDIDKHGCKVIPIYATIIKSENFDIIDSLEEDNLLMKKFLKIFYINNDLSSLIFKNNGLKTIILNNGMNKKFIENFSYIVKKALHKKDIREIQKDPSYLNYYILSAYYAKSKKDTLKLYKKIKSSISLELLPSFTFILSAIGEDYEFEELLESFSAIREELSTDAIKNLAQYPKYFVYFLYPKKVDLDTGTISNYKLQEIQQDIQKKVLYFYASMFEKYRYTQGVNQQEYALLSIEYIYPYLLEQYQVDSDKFTILFHVLIENGYLISLFTEYKCSNKSKENFAIFGNGNISNAVRLQKEESLFSDNLLHKLGNSQNAIFSYFYVSNFYNTLSSKEEWYLFKDLLKVLPYEYEYKVAFLKRLEKNGYFRNMVTRHDYKDAVYAEDGTHYPKYKYILVTPYPSKKDETLFRQILTTNIPDDKLKDSLLVLMKKNTDELATHTFTTFDKFASGLEVVDNIDDALFVLSIASAPFTGGISLSYIAISTVKKAAKMGAKKGFKSMTKKVILKSLKFVNKGIFIARKGRKTVDGVVGLNKVKNIGKVVDKFGDINDFAQITAIGGPSLYLYFNYSQSGIEQICKEQ